MRTHAALRVWPRLGQKTDGTWEMGMCIHTCTGKQHTWSRHPLTTRTLGAKTHFPKAALPQYSDELKVADPKSVGRIKPNAISFFDALLSLSS